MYDAFARLSTMPCLARTLLAHRIEFSPVIGIARQMFKSTRSFLLSGKIAQIASARQVRLLTWACFWLSFLGLSYLLRSSSVDRAPDMGFRDCVAETFPSMPHATPIPVPSALSGCTFRLVIACSRRSPLISQIVACWWYWRIQVARWLSEGLWLGFRQESACGLA